MDNNNLGLILRERRKEKGLTLGELSSLARVSPREIGRIEMEKCFPKGRTLRKLANPLGFGEVELMKLAEYEVAAMAKGNCTHWWIIDSDNVGRCRYCPEVRDFARLLRREGQLSGSKAKKGGTKSKRGRKKKEQFDGYL